MTTTETPLLIDENYRCESQIVDRDLMGYATGSYINRRREDYYFQCRICGKRVFLGEAVVVLRHREREKGQEVWKRYGVFCSVACQRKAYFDALVAQNDNCEEIRQIRKEFRQILSLERRAIGYKSPRSNFDDKDEE